MAVEEMPVAARIVARSAVRETPVSLRMLSLKVPSFSLSGADDDEVSILSELEDARRIFRECGMREFGMVDFCPIRADLKEHLFLLLLSENADVGCKIIDNVMKTARTNSKLREWAILTLLDLDL
jgi:hypothetical protein